MSLEIKCLTEDCNEILPNLNSDIQAGHVSCGDTVACEECGNVYEVVNLDPLQFKLIEDDDSEDEDDED